MNQDLQIVSCRIYGELGKPAKKMTVFWDVAPCSLVEDYRHFRGAYCLHHQGDESTIAL
jgi:hypothetical protein